ncbi:unnamed protein product [Pleuronectes platessa]|uniref:Uncharacterized protein n=1 Tax=Pleuronectes platessa TaxID=8262 RepID=A0A9N7Z4A1_PLEPL|nr:unnamed protein product [Pleuronectes platessa]
MNKVMANWLPNSAYTDNLSILKTSQGSETGKITAPKGKFASCTQTRLKFKALRVEVFPVCFWVESLNLNFALMVTQVTQLRGPLDGNMMGKVGKCKEGEMTGSVHSEAKMGHSQTRLAHVASVEPRLPSPRTVCAHRLAEPHHRICCHHQHFSFPERAISYSPPYSPNLFKRLDRR